MITSLENCLIEYERAERIQGFCWMYIHSGRSALLLYHDGQLKNKKIPKKDAGFRVCLYCTYIQCECPTTYWYNGVPPRRLMLCHVHIQNVLYVQNDLQKKVDEKARHSDAYFVPSMNDTEQCFAKPSLENCSCSVQNVSYMSW